MKIFFDLFLIVTILLAVDVIFRTEKVDLFSAICIGLSLCAYVGLLFTPWILFGVSALAFSLLTVILSKPTVPEMAYYFTWFLMFVSGLLPIVDFYSDSLSLITVV